MTGYGTAGQSPPAAKKDLPLFDLIGAGLGVLSFIWGFLNFYSSGGSDAKGYEAFANGTGPIGLSILASALAGAVVLSGKADPVRPPYALAAAVAALLTTFGALVGKGSVSASIGLYLLLATTIAQVALFGYSWLLATGKISAPKPKVAQQQWGGPQQYGQPPTQGPGGYGQQPGGYGPPPSSAPSGYGQPGPGYGQPTQVGSPGGYEPPGSGGYPPPSGYGSPTSAPPAAPRPGQPQPGQPQPGQSQPGQPQPGQPGQAGPTPGGGYGPPPTPGGGYSQG